MPLHTSELRSTLNLARAVLPSSVPFQIESCLLERVALARRFRLRTSCVSSVAHLTVPLARLSAPLRNTGAISWVFQQLSPRCRGLLLDSSSASSVQLVQLARRFTPQRGLGRDFAVGENQPPLAITALLGYSRGRVVANPQPNGIKDPRTQRASREPRSSGTGMNTRRSFRMEVSPDEKTLNCNPLFPLIRPPERAKAASASKVTSGIFPLESQGEISC